MQKYHFFIPGIDPVEVIHWVDTLSDFQALICHKRKFEPGFRCFSAEEEVKCRVMNPDTMQADDFYLSELLSLDEIEI
jgi:hypothetical protein